MEKLQKLRDEYAHEMNLTDHESETPRAKELREEYNEINELVEDTCSKCESKSRITCQFH